MPEFLVPLTFAVIIASIVLCMVAIWAWRRELSMFFGITPGVPRQSAEQEQLLRQLKRHAALEARLIDQLSARQASEPDVLEFEAATRTVAENLPRLKRLLAQREPVPTKG